MKAEEKDALRNHAYQRLRGQYEQRHGSVPDAAELLLNKAAYLEALHEEARQRIDSKGLQERYAVSTYRDGERENKSLGQMLKIQAAQTRILRELRLLPGARPSANADTEDDGDEDINDY